MNSLNSTTRSQSEIKESEEMSKYLDRRVTEIEKSFTNLTNEFVAYARRTAKLRNNGDQIANILMGYVSNQQFNSSSHECIREFCSTISCVEDLRNAELDRIQNHVIRPMMEYNGCLKDLKAEIKKDMAARKKEIASYKKLDKSRNGNTVDEAKARASTQLAVLDATRQSDKLIKTVTQFEKAKLEHVPAVLKSFIHIEMLWHTRALERYTEAYRTINNIDCQGDLNEFLEDLRNFRSQDHLMRSNSNLNLASRRAQSMDNLRMTHASSHGDISGRNEMRTSVTFEDQHKRSNSFQQPGNFGPASRDLSKAKPPLANVQSASASASHLANSDGSEYTDDEDDDDYTEDGTTTASRTASARGNNRPVPQKRGR